MDKQPNWKWLDAETQSLLSGVVPNKLAPPTTETFSVVVLAQNNHLDQRQTIRAFDRILGTSHIDAVFQTTRQPPFIVKRQLCHADAMIAQFELICCDVVSVFIMDAVMTQADAAYLAQLYGELLESDEFASVQVSLQVPDDAAGRSLVDQFVHRPFSVYTQQMTMTRKKARIMTHWAIRCGGNVARLS